ncbi:MarR family transcriptional regulator [Glaciihabitans sp. UYNi722]|uniref:MarR family winged helix-turn-helix transcriptional regulator n=1 Tax=Glaciihabitans sp. UYNi722 TaxID=3156344 RepID=UPI003399D230
MSRLTDAQQEAWRSLMTATLVLDGALDRQSQRDGGMPHAHYKVLVVLYETSGRRLAMSALAAQLRYSPSRLTHTVVSMEKSGWLQRSRSTDDRRVQIVQLTEVGIRLVKKVSPIQATEVRARAFSQLSTKQVQQLDAITAAIVEGLDDQPAS